MADNAQEAEAQAIIDEINESLGTSLTTEADGATVINIIASSDNTDVMVDQATYDAAIETAKLSDNDAVNATAVTTALRDAAGLGVTNTSTMTDAELVTAIKTARIAGLSG